MSELPFIIRARVNRGDIAIFTAERKGEAVATARYAVGNARRRNATASAWAVDTRLTDGVALDVFTLERELEAAELRAMQALDARHEEEAVAAENQTAAQVPDDEKKERGPSQATMLVDLVNAFHGLELWHDPDGTGYATIPAGGHYDNENDRMKAKLAGTFVRHFENWPIRSKRFKQWASRLFYEQNEKVAGGQAVQDALNTIEGQAVHSGKEYGVHVRLAGHDGNIYLDLCNEKWECVRITADGWSVVGNAPVKFRRARGSMPLPIPTRGGNLADLWRFVNVKLKSAFILIVSWLLGAMRAKGPYPVLELDGEQGSAKSTTQRVLRRVIDPNKADLRSQPRDERDLVIAANNGWIIGLDNLSYCKDQLSDALCRISTGGGFSTRELYTDSEEAIFDGSRPILLNGINEIATRSDLLDRTIRVILPTIDDSKRRVEAVFWREFDAARPGILGALLDAVCMALRNENAVELERTPRMADFARWVVAAEPLLPWKPGEFMDAYSGNRAEAHELAIEASPVGSAFRRWIGTQGGHWTGHATDLMGHLERFALNGVADNRPDGWPKRANGLSHILRRLAPNFRAVGIGIQFGTDNQRTITVGPMPQKTVFSASSDGDGVDPHGQNDENDDSHDCSSGLDPDIADAMGDGTEERWTDSPYENKGGDSP